MASELESDLRDTGNWCRKWLAYFNALKTQLVSFDWSHNSGAIDRKQMGLFLKKNHALNSRTFSSKLNWCSFVISIAKTVSKKIGALIHTLIRSLDSFCESLVLLRLLFISINVPYGLAWNAVVMSW